MTTADDPALEPLKSLLSPNKDTVNQTLQEIQFLKDCFSTKTPEWAEPENQGLDSEVVPEKEEVRLLKRLEGRRSLSRTAANIDILTMLAQKELELKQAGQKNQEADHALEQSLAQNKTLREEVLLLHDKLDQLAKARQDEEQNQMDLKLQKNLEQLYKQDMVQKEKRWQVKMGEDKSLLDQWREHLNHTEDELKILTAELDQLQRVVLQTKTEEEPQPPDPDLKKNNRRKRRLRKIEQA